MERLTSNKAVIEQLKENKIVDNEEIINFAVAVLAEIAECAR